MRSPGVQRGCAAPLCSVVARLQLHRAGVLGGVGGGAVGAHGGAEQPASTGGQAAPGGLTRTQRTPKKLLEWSRSTQHPPQQHREGGPTLASHGHRPGASVSLTPQGRGPVQDPVAEPPAGLARGNRAARPTAGFGLSGSPRWGDGVCPGVLVHVCAWRVHGVSWSEHSTCVGMGCARHLHSMCMHTGGLHVGMGRGCVYGGVCMKHGGSVHVHETWGVCLRGGVHAHVWGLHVCLGNVHLWWGWGCACVGCVHTGNTVCVCARVHGACNMHTHCCMCMGACTHKCVSCMCVHTCSAHAHMCECGLGVRARICVCFAWGWGGMPVCSGCAQLCTLCVCTAMGL